MVHFSLFFFNDTATTEIYTLSLHDALPILTITTAGSRGDVQPYVALGLGLKEAGHEVRLATYTPFEGFVRDRKSTRLNSSHANISYAVFCLKKKKKNNSITRTSILIIQLA